jgi:hypothetical protein
VTVDEGDHRFSGRSSSATALFTQSFSLLVEQPFFAAINLTPIQQDV